MGRARRSTPTPRLRTERLDLDPLAPADADEMAHVLADPALYTFIGGEPPTLDGLRARFQRLAAGRSADGTEAWHNWIVRERHGGRAVGTVQATVATVSTAAEESPQAEIAWVIGTPWQGKGYAGEAARALVSWLESCAITTIEALIHPDHAASATVARRAGLQATAEVRDGERVWRRPPGPG